MTATRSVCFTCTKQTSTFKCEGCLENFCRNDLNKHLAKLDEELDITGNNYDQLREELNKQKNEINNHSLLDEITKWEVDSIEKIKQTANECRERLNKYLNEILYKTEDKLNELAKQITSIRSEKEFNELHINRFRDNLNKLKETVKKQTNISIKQQQQSTSFINKILFTNDITFTQENTKWKQHGITIAGGNGQGNQSNQLHSPVDIVIGHDQTIYVTDRENHRIIAWKSNSTNGHIIASRNGPGSQSKQLNHPTHMIIDEQTDSLIISDHGNRRVMRWSPENNTKNGETIISNIDCSCLTLDKNGSLYVSDWDKHEVRRWRRGETEGTLIAGGNGKGDRLNQLNNPTYLFIDENDTLYVSDTDNHRVMKWSKNAKVGIIVAGGNGKGNSLSQLSGPRGVIVDQLGQLYVANYHNDRVMRWCEGDKEETIVVGGNGEGKQANQFNGPHGLLFDREGNLYVADCRNHRIQKFELD